MKMAPVPDSRRITQIAFGSNLIVAALTLAGAVVNLLRPIYFEAAIALVSLLIFIWVQFFLNRSKWLRNPPVMQICIAVLTFSSLTIGRFFFLYKTVPGFDKSQHFLYGAVFAILGLVLFYRQNPDSRRRLAVSPGTLIIFAACFALTCGFIWEIYEFANDRLFNTNMQGWKQGLIHGLIDTMLDLLADLAGGLLLGLLAVRRMRPDPHAFYNQYFSGFFSEAQTAEESVEHD